MPANRSAHLPAILLTALAPISWGTTYAVTTEFLPPDRPSSPVCCAPCPPGSSCSR